MPHQLPLWHRLMRLESHSTMVDETAYLHSLTQDLTQLLQQLCRHRPSTTTDLSHYGLPDLSYFNPLSEKHKSDVCDYLQSTIECFEPRLHEVLVSELSTITQQLDCMSFRITGAVQFPSTLTLVHFNSVIATATGDVHLEAEYEP